MGIDFFRAVIKQFDELERMEWYEKMRKSRVAIHLAHGCG